MLARIPTAPYSSAYHASCHTCARAFAYTNITASYDSFTNYVCQTDWAKEKKNRVKMSRYVVCGTCAVSYGQLLNAFVLIAFEFMYRNEMKWSAYSNNKKSRFRHVVNFIIQVKIRAHSRCTARAIFSVGSFFFPQQNRRCNSNGKIDHSKFNGSHTAHSIWCRNTFDFHTANFCYVIHEANTTATNSETTFEITNNQHIQADLSFENGRCENRSSAK